jgi:hypothetical protein
MKNIFSSVVISFALACTVSTTDNFQNPPPPPPSTCAPSDTVLGCTAGSIGYACTSDRPDDGDTNLVCSAGRAGANGALFCCVPFGQSFNECTTDTTVVGCADPGFGFSCAGAVGPADVDARLACSNAIGAGYCCVAGDVSPSCAPAPGAACGGASIGFSCSASASPGDDDAPVACDVGTPGEAGATTRCCIPFLQSKSSCEENQNVGCTSGSFGFTCAGLARPETTNAALTCAPATSAASSYCCTL